MPKRILIVSDHPTHPCKGGNQQCIMQYADVLRQLGYEVYFLQVWLYGTPAETLQATRNHWGDHYLEYRTPAWQVFCQRVVRRLKHDAYPDILDFVYPCGLNTFINRKHSELDFTGVIVNYIWLSRIAFCNIPVKALFTHDVFTNRRESIPQQYWYSFSAHNEERALRRFRHVLAIQDRERDFFQLLSPASRVVSVYSSFRFVDQPLTNSKNILFFSGGGQLNLNGIHRFLEDVFPILLERDSEIKLLIGGNICRSLESETLPPNVILKGPYDNPDDFYALGDICINPVYEGSGLKIKSFEAIAHGKYTIVHPHDAIGIYDPKNAPLTVAETKEEFVEAVMEAWDSPSLLTNNKMYTESYIKALNYHIRSVYYSIFRF